MGRSKYTVQFRSAVDEINPRPQAIDIYGTAVTAGHAPWQQEGEQDPEIADCASVAVCDAVADQTRARHEITEPSYEPRTFDESPPTQEK